jgi:hypothetical protein
MLSIQIDTLNKINGFLPLIINEQRQTVWLGSVQQSRAAAYQLATDQLRVLIHALENKI